jgi:fluoroacetyl-CoA thioesterase
MHRQITVSPFTIARMSKPVPIGARGESQWTVEEKHTLKAYDPKLPPVLSTPQMIGWMEVAGANALQPYCEGDELSVGTAINIEHVAACTVGAAVRCAATLEGEDGKQYVFRVTAMANQNGHSFEVGRGTVSRSFVSLGRFTKRLEAMKAQQS